MSRVVAGRHSQVLWNVFSLDTADVDPVYSVVPSERQPLAGRCCCNKCFCCCGCCDDTGDAGEVDPALREALQIDKEQKTLLAGSGYTFKEIVPKLKEAGMILPGAPGHQGITVGGALATAAHEGGLYQMSLGGYLLEIWVRAPDGETRHFTKEESPDELAMAAVSLGMLGAIVQAKFTLQPARNLRLVETTLPYKPESMNTLSPQTNTFLFAPYVQRMERQDREPTDDPVDKPDCCSSLLGCCAGAACTVRCTEPCFVCCPVLTSCFFKCQTGGGTKVVDGNDTFDTTASLQLWNLGVAYDPGEADAVFAEYSRVIEEQRSRGRYLTYRWSARPIAAVDPSYVLAMSAGGDKVAFDVNFSDLQPGREEFMDAIAAIGKKFRGRPHLGKALREKDLGWAAEVYGAANGGLPWLRFAELREKYDPKKTLLNRTLRSFLEQATAAAKAASAGDSP